MNTFEALIKISTLLAEGKVKESLGYYHEPTDKAPEYTHWMEELLSSLPDAVKERYFFEISGIDNELADLKNEHYYERLQRRGVPLISTIGDRLQYRITLLQNAVENGQLGFLEQQG